ncbi:hypothetical protein DFH11DRAFT_190503 [Phellopilus nigrolimitatus]|nr:hypothetical protein DFH11DRAFT_190503 [Phellopilus nigrolimitatus]
MDIYCQTAILRALSTTRYARTPGFVLLTETRQIRNFIVGNRCMSSLNRHCDADGTLVHVCDYACVENSAGKTKDELFFHPQAVLRLRVQRGEAFSSAFFRGSCDPRNCAVTEGMKPESLRLEVRDKGILRRRMRIPDSFAVYVLRYEPDAYAWTQDWYGFGVAGLDPTGPFAWRAVK